jgi:hypothetical protein
MPADDNPLRPGALPELSAPAQEMLDGLIAALHRLTDPIPSGVHPAVVFSPLPEQPE